MDYSAHKSRYTEKASRIYCHVGQVVWYKAKHIRSMFGIRKDTIRHEQNLLSHWSLLCMFSIGQDTF